MHVLQTRRHELGSTWHPSLRSWPALQRRWPEVDAAMTSTELLAVRALSGAVREVACGKLGRWTRAKDAGFDYLRASRMTIELL